MKNATGIKENKKNKLTFREKATAKLLYPIISKIIDTAYNQTKFYIELNCENGIISKMPTQEEFADQLGIALNTVSRIEIGQRGISVDLAIELVVRFNTTLDFIYLGRE